MEVHPLLGQLDSLLNGEKTVGGRGRGLSAPPSSGISPGMRDGSAHVLRCLKVWYDLPSDVFHTAVANIDTFLAKMKVTTALKKCLLATLLGSTSNFILLELKIGYSYITLLLFNEK